MAFDVARQGLPDRFDAVLASYPEVVNFASSQHGFDQNVVAQVNASFPKGPHRRFGASL